MADKNTHFSPIVRELPTFSPTTAGSNAETVQVNPLDRYLPNLVGLALVNPQVTLMECGNSVVRCDYKTISEVRVISGGPASWEPAFSHFVGPGFLTAAVQGELSAAPTTKQILQTLRELSVNHVGGILVIVRGDIPTTICFGLAVERARNESIYTKLISVNDDALNHLLPKNKKLNRGLSGAILIQKMAGAMAQSGKCMSEVYDFCHTALDYLISSMVVVDPVTGLPDPLSRLERKCSASGVRGTSGKVNCFCNEAELGAGVVPEPQIEVKDPSESKFSTLDWDGKEGDFNDSPSAGDLQAAVTQARTKDLSLASIAYDLVEQLMSAKLDFLSLPLVVLLNTNHVSKLDEMELCREIAKLLLDKKANVVRFYVGTFMNLPGITLSILRVFSLDVVSYLDQPASAMGWNGLASNGTFFMNFDNLITRGRLIRKELLTPLIRGPALTNFQTAVLELVTQFSCDALISCERQINIIDRDHDLGTRIKVACTLIANRLASKRLVTNYPFTFFTTLGRLLESRLGGVSGSIYSVMCEKVGKYFGTVEASESVSVDVWLTALEHAVGAVKKYGNVDFGDQTMYDPLYGCYEVLRRDLNSGVYYLEAFCSGLQAAERIVDNTKEANDKYPDVGCHVVGIWLRAIFEGVKLRCT